MPRRKSTKMPIQHPPPRKVLGIRESATHYVDVQLELEVELPYLIHAADVPEQIEVVMDDGRVYHGDVFDYTPGYQDTRLRAMVTEGDA